VYDDDIFGGVQGVKSSSTTVTYDDVFSMRSASQSAGPASFEDLLGDLGKNKAPVNSQPSGDEALFDDLIPGFGNTEPAKPRGSTDTKRQHPTDSPKKPADDPFVVLDAESFSSNASSTTFHDPLEEFSMPTQSASMTDTQSASNGTIGIDDVFDGFSQTVPSAPSLINKSRTDRSPLKTSQSSIPQKSGSRDTVESRSVKKDFVNNLEKNHEKIYSSPPIADFDLSGSADVSIKSTLNRDEHSLHEDFTSDLNPQGAPPPSKSDYGTEFANDRWITVDDIVLCTQPILAPPPTRPPPPLVSKQGPSSKKSSDSKVEAYAAANFNRFSSYPQPAQSKKSSEAAFDDDRPSVISSIEELEDFAMGGSRVHAQGKHEIPSNGEQIDGNSAAAAAMKEAMEKAEAKLRQAKEARKREREEREREATMVKQDREETAVQFEEKERAERAVQEAREREEREKEDQERERRRIEREREKEREREREREKDRIAVERATKEARERAATEAREKAQRAAVDRATKEARERAATDARERAERASAERAASEARERAERAAFERAAAEARERAATEARERMVAERAAVERAATEVRLRAERAAVERANAEARERAAERASAERAAAAKERQRRNDDDLDSFFSMGHRPNSAPKQRPATPDTTFASQVQNKGFSSEGPRRTPAGVPSGLRKAAPPTNVPDDFTSLFTASSSEEFQEFEGETEERRRARLDRHQRTLERASKALAEKNERDMQAQRDQAERHRFAETLDAEIKRWAAGKEGNLRALLSTLQYVLWPESGWQAVSLTDIIIGSSVKKVYRKATLCVHPDKVQQKGATIQQKYIAEKVFDLLKEAWNKFNSEELF
jgi:hypothetical protein